MIRLTRFAAEPRVLAEKKVEWLAAYKLALVINPKKHPHSSQYAHKEVVDALERMSFHKCFYCEQSTKECGKEIDHFIEVAEDPDGAFVWTNLYLSCGPCNKKLPNRTVPVTDCLDPCDPTVEPREHLTFEKEQIRSRNGSVRGRETIRKYKLDRADLDLKRSRMLHLLNDTALAILRKMNADGRHVMTLDESEVLHSFCQPEHPFSLMFTVQMESMSL
jgi:uncharacterized protein (TIGR02646 family)